MSAGCADRRALTGTDPQTDETDGRAAIAAISGMIVARHLTPGDRRRQEPLNRSFLIPSALIFDSNVEPGMPSLAAAPDGPDTRPLLEARASSIICRSRATSSSASG